MAKIYVSSTRLDLEPERKAVIDWLVAARHQPVHSYVADSDTVRDSCLKDVLECDAYVLILGYRYGNVPEQNNPEGHSITELEYACASEAKKPCVVLIPKGVRDIDLTDLRHPEIDAKVQAFRSKVNSERRAAMFADEKELIAELTAGLLNVLRSAARDNQRIDLEAALAGKPLTSLQLTWEFRGLDTALTEMLNKASEDAIDWITDEQGPRDDEQNAAVFREYELYPFLTALGRRLTSTTSKAESANVVVLLTIDDDRNAVLSFGFLDDETPWRDPATRVDKHANRPSVEVGTHAHEGNSDLRNWPSLKNMRDGNLTITWRLDPSTLAKSLSRQNEHVLPSANLPSVVRAAILFDIKDLPFEAGNLSLPVDEDFWECRDNSHFDFDLLPESGPVIAHTFSSALRLVPNNLSWAPQEYSLNKIYESVFVDSYGEADPDVRCVVFEYARQI